MIKNNKIIKLFIIVFIICSSNIHVMANTIQENVLNIENNKNLKNEEIFSNEIRNSNQINELIENNEKLDKNTEFENIINQIDKQKDNNVIKEKMKLIFSLIIKFLPILLLIIILKNINKVEYDYGENGKKILSNESYYKKIPVNNNIIIIYYIALKFGLIKNKRDIIYAVFFKWLKQSIISIEDIKTGNFIKKENLILHLYKNESKKIIDDKEMELFELIYGISDNGELQYQTFEKWCLKNYTLILKWVEELEGYIEKGLINVGLITFKDEVKYKIFRKHKIIMNPKIKEEAKKIAGLKYYLLDYVIINNGLKVSDELYEDYIIFSQILGIFNVVTLNLERIHPDTINNSKFKSYDNLINLNDFLNNALSNAIFEKNK